MDDIFRDEPAAPPAPRGSSRNVLQILWQRRWLLFLGLTLGAVLGLLGYSQRPAVYRTSAQVLVIKKQETSALTGTPGADPRMAAMDDYVGTHLFLIRSPVVVERAVRTGKLDTLRSLQPNPAAAVQAGLTAERAVSKDAPTTAGNSIINLSFTGADPADVEVVLRAVITAYREFLEDTYKNSSENLINLITDATDKLQRKLSDKDKEYREFRKSSKDLVLRSDTGATMNHHAGRVVDLLKLESDAMQKANEIKARLAKIKVAQADSQPADVILALASRQFDKGAPPPSTDLALKNALFQLKKQETELLTFGYGEKYPGVVRIRAEIEQTKEYFKELDEIAKTAQAGADPVSAAVGGLRREQSIIEANLAAIRESLTAEKQDARGLEQYDIEDEGFRKEITRLQKTLDQTLARLEQIDLIRGYGGFEARAIAPPAAGVKVSPVFFQFLVMGAALGLLLGSGGAYLLDLADKSFRTPEEIRRRLGLPLVGHVPFTPKSVEAVVAIDATGNRFELDPGLIAVHRPASPEAEAFRGVRTALYFSTQGERHKVVQVTSPQMGDGKTTLITNLAVSIAQSGRRVLLIDADLRRPRVHRAFGLAGKVGLAEVIAGTAELEAAVQPTTIPNLSVLPCGRRPPNPAELLTSPRFEDVLDDVRGAYDFVLVDTPPLLAVSDPCIVAPRVDGLLLTIRVSKNGRPAAERARDLLIGLKVTCLGVVVNGVGKHGAMTGYGYDHYKYADAYASDYTSADPDADPSPAEPTPAAPRLDFAHPGMNGHAPAGS